MLNFNSVLIGSSDPEKLAAFYEKVFDRKPDMAEGGFHGWVVGSAFLNIGPHSEVKGSSQEPQRILLNFETNNVKEEFDRIKVLGATVIKEASAMKEAPDFWLATLADPDGNYFQLVSPWKQK